MKHFVLVMKYDICPFVPRSGSCAVTVRIPRFTPVFSGTVTWYELLKQHEKTTMAMENIHVSLVYKTRIKYTIMYVEKDEKKTFRMFKRLHQVYVVLSKYKIRIVIKQGHK